MLNQDQIKHLGLLSRLQITEEESQRLLKDIEKIVAYISRLKEIKTQDKNCFSFKQDYLNVYRDDTGKSLSLETRQDILSQAPQAKGEYFKVKKII